MLIRLAAPVPPTLLTALGVPEPMVMHLGLYPGFDGVARFTDGRVCGACCPSAFGSYSRHPAVAPLLAGYPLGPGGVDCFWLLLDSTRYAVYASPADWAREFCESQWPYWIAWTVIEPPEHDTPERQAAEREIVGWLDRRPTGEGRP